VNPQLGSSSRPGGQSSVGSFFTEVFFSVMLLVANDDPLLMMND
jgi:hypothetical protein